MLSLIILGKYGYAQTCDYEKRKLITIDNSKVEGSSDFSDFPVLVSVTDADLASITYGGQVTSSFGFDIQFTATDGITLLSHQLEKYDETTGELVCWVNIPTLDHDDDTELYIVYGNSSVSTDQSSTSTWDANFQAVWHLNDATGATVRDGTVNGRDGTPTSSPPTATGKVGSCLDFQGSPDEVTITGYKGVTGTQDRTIEGWLKKSGSGEGAIISWGDNTITQKSTFLMYGSQLRYEVRGGYCGGNSILNDGNWHHFALTWSNDGSPDVDEGLVYIDGMLETMVTIDEPVSTSAITDVRIGVDFQSRYTDADYDELRISDIARSADWIKTSYNSQNAPSTFMSFGAEEDFTKRYWVSSSASNWNNSSNWSWTSGGTGGAPVPCEQNDVYFDLNGLGNCNLDINASIHSISVSGYTSTIEMAGYTLTAAGDVNNTFTSGIIDNSGSSILTINSTGTAYSTFNGTTFNTEINSTSPQLTIQNSTFNNPVTIEKNGNGNNTSLGGNTFNDHVIISSTGAGYLSLGNGSNSTINGNLTINHSGAHTLTLAQNSGHTLTINGNTTVNKTDGSVLYLNYDGDIIFNGTLSLSNTSSSYLFLGSRNTGNLTFNGNVEVSSTGSSLGIYIADNGASSMNTSAVLSIGSSGFNSGTLHLGQLTLNSTSGHTLNLTGTTTLFECIGTNCIGDLTVTTPDFEITTSTFGADLTLTKTGSITAKSYGGNTIQGNFQMTNASAGSIHLNDHNSRTDTYNGDVSLFLNGTNHFNLCKRGNAVINGTSRFTHNGAGGVLSLCGSGDVIFNGPTYLSNFSTGNNPIRGSYGSGTLIFNSNLYLEGNSSTGQIHLGRNGLVTLSSGYTISEGPAGYLGGHIFLQNFLQVGTTVQNLTVTGGKIESDGATWNGNTTLTAPELIVENSTFNGDATLTKNGGTNSDSQGGNVFNGTTTVTNSGTARLRFATTATDDYNDDVYWTKSGTGGFDLIYGQEATISGDLYLNLNTVNTMGMGTNSKLTFDGTSDQYIRPNTTSEEARFRNIDFNNGSHDIYIQTDVVAVMNINLLSGDVYTSSSAILGLQDNGTISSAGADSYVDGPFLKRGNDAFTFPCGDEGYFAPLSISAPASSTDEFQAHYIFKNADDDGYNRVLKETSISHISWEEYWILDRMNGSSNVEVTLSWDSPRSGIVDNLPELLVARWDGSEWKDHGNASTTGNTTSGTVTSNGAVSNFSPFTLASTSANNPLPIELLLFEAHLSDEQVELQWATESERNNDYFEIQKSANGVSFETVLTANGQEYSNSRIDYYEVDYEPYSGKSYYRLKQVDINGNSNYSNIVPVFNETSHSFVSVCPNPVSDLEETKIRIHGARGQEILLVLRDVSGKEFYSKASIMDQDDQLIAFPYDQNIPPGVYLITATTLDEIYSQKIIIQ